MPTDRELMQQALDALEYCGDQEELFAREALAIEALRARLAQPEQDSECSYCDGAGCAACDARVLSSEPVAWMLTGGSDIYLASDFEPDAESLFNWTPLFTAPPQRDWAGLTTAETKVLWNLTKKPREYAEMIEAKLKERNT